MTNPTDSKLKVIKIMDPLLCVRCGNAYIADVVMRDGGAKKMFYCSRLDCDNWVAKSDTATENTDLDLAA
jgi:alpha-D-ribose 1-methylphosphonate 5-phosphate C-P lyase